mgnify:FL=1
MFTGWRDVVMKTESYTKRTSNLAVWIDPIQSANGRRQRAATKD